MSPCRPSRGVEFQSAPGWLAGRCLCVPIDSGTSIEVSIRARLVGRAMPETTRDRIARPEFQSAPGWLAGRCCSQRRARIHEHRVSIRARLVGRAMRLHSTQCRPRRRVSIRARLVGRAMPVVARHAACQRHVSIRARLVGRAMPSALRHARRDRWFQSAPGWLAGRCRSLPRASREALSFNPRPAGWPGDARQMRD